MWLLFVTCAAYTFRGYWRTMLVLLNLFLLRMVTWSIFSISLRLKDFKLWLTIDDIKKEIQMIMWAHYEVDVCRKDFVLLLDTVRTAANDDSKNQLVKVDHCDSVATVLRQWEMPCGTAAEGVRIRFDPCWKNYVQLTSCTWRPFARPLRHQWKSLRAWPAIKGGCWWHYIELMSCVAGLDVCRFTEFDFSYMVVYCVCVCVCCVCRVRVFVVFVVCVCDCRVLCVMCVCVSVCVCVLLVWG